MPWLTVRWISSEDIEATVKRNSITQECPEKLEGAKQIWTVLKKKL
jgi:hypothetical protein